MGSLVANSTRTSNVVRRIVTISILASTSERFSGVDAVSVY